jgi:hypothetical protein
MRLTIPHYFDFSGDRHRVGRRLTDAGAWDAIRESSGPFGLLRTREEWERQADSDGVAARARDIAALARALGARHVCSYGVGTGVLELALLRAAPDLTLTCTDYAPRTVERLRSLFPEARVLRHDLAIEAPVAADFHLLHRVDTEFGNAKLAEILGRFEEPILLVPGVLLTWRLALREVLVPLLRPGATRAGWVRSESALRALWRGTCESRDVTVGDEPAYLLTPRASRE